MGPASPSSRETRNPRPLPPGPRAAIPAATTRPRRAEPSCTRRRAPPTGVLLVSASTMPGLPRHAWRTGAGPRRSQLSALFADQSSTGGHLTTEGWTETGIGGQSQRHLAGGGDASRVSPDSPLSISGDAGGGRRAPGGDETGAWPTRLACGARWSGESPDRTDEEHGLSDPAELCSQSAHPTSSYKGSVCRRRRCHHVVNESSCRHDRPLAPRLDRHRPPPTATDREEPTSALRKLVQPLSCATP